ncbi:sensor histidine kinase [Chitinophaga sp. NPDC101104]|uniref:sensor histidine kinase n=1 Tax=Chitinophaga sp. NPDC101104 TaxID=3390561 RepID=UPI003D00581C
MLRKQGAELERMEGLLGLKLLQSRLNPHFLFNSLNSIQYFISLDDKKTSLQYIGRFSAFLRKMIQYGDETAIQLNDEAELVRDYLLLEQYRFPDRFDFEINLAGDTGLEDIPPFLTHHLVEEALYRGVLHLDRAEKGWIRIDVKPEGDSIRMEISDNGKPGAFGRETEDHSAMLDERIRRYNALHTRNVRLESRKASVEGGRENTAIVTIR